MEEVGDIIIGNVGNGMSIDYVAVLFSERSVPLDTNAGPRLKRPGEEQIFLHPSCSCCNLLYRVSGHRNSKLQWQHQRVRLERIEEGKQVGRTCLNS